MSRLSFSIYTNYKQCPFRVALLHTKPKTTLFREQYLGLYAHEWIERYLRMKINTEDVSFDFDDINKSIIREDRILACDITIDVHEFENKLTKWGEQILQFMGRNVDRVLTEYKAEKQYGQHLVVGVADVIAFSVYGNYVIDLKRSNYVRKYDSKQTTLYSWLLEEFNIRDSHLVFLKDKPDVEIETVSFQLKHNEAVLGEILNTLNKVGEILDLEMWEYLPPNIGDRTCHPNRCSVFYMCPYGNKMNEVDYEVAIQEAAAEVYINEEEYETNEEHF